MKNYREVASEVENGVKWLAKDAPETMSAFFSMVKATTGREDGALSRKAKELIALAIAVSAKCDACVAYHAKAVLDAGANREEVLEAVGVAKLMGGSIATVNGIEALVAYDQFFTDENYPTTD